MRINITKPFERYLKWRVRILTYVSAAWRYGLWIRELSHPAPIFEATQDAIQPTWRMGPHIS